MRGTVLTGHVIEIPPLPAGGQLYIEQYPDGLVTATVHSREAPEPVLLSQTLRVPEIQETQLERQIVALEAVIERVREAVCEAQEPDE